MMATASLLELVPAYADNAKPASTASPAASSTPHPSCPARQPRIRLSVVDPEPARRTDRGIDALHVATGRARGPTVHHLALTTSRVEWRSQLGARTTTRPGPHPHTVCAVPERVTLTLVQSEHVVRIARELAPGTCLYRAVAAHEARHVAVNRRTLQAAGTQAREAATAWAAAAEGHGATEAAAMATLQRELRRAVEPALAAMRVERDAAHGAIDTPEEYRRLGQVCPADQRVLRAKLRGLRAD